METVNQPPAPEKTPTASVVPDNVATAGTTGTPAPPPTASAKPPAVKTAAEPRPVASDAGYISRIRGH